MTESGAKKNDQGKNRLDLVPPSVILDLSEVLTHGAQKYEPYNWCKGFSWSRVYAATQRHLLAWFNGETNDPESGLNHLQHVFCNIAFLLVFRHTHPELDDRPFKQEQS